MNFLIKYFVGNEEKDDKYLGEENLVNIEEFLSFDVTDEKKIYLNKKFSASECYRWKVLEVRDVSAVDQERSLVVFLQSEHNDNEEFLTQTLKRNKKSNHGGINKLLFKGKLVEVEFGHYHSVFKLNNDIRSNKRYTSTLQHGEMHKRRLAIVVKVQGSMVQVVPITSSPASASDKSAFILEPSTLEKTVYYKENHDSWVICSMIQTVSASRILPLEIKRKYREKRDRPRNTLYILRISKKDSINLDRALLHSVNLGEYEQAKLENIKLKAELDEKISENESLIFRLQDAEKYKEFCKRESMEPDDYSN
ncbi:type II toxin-antitoxin system PemK/MazF family toxin [Acinetobacter baumannii]|nr:type II toxin-antitoxin system PemK/MazF family toxin [Acinetobacter baumannii]